MRIKEIEGVEYVAKSDIENAFKDRISKLSARAVQAEEAAQALQTELDNQTGKLGSLDTLQSKIEDLQAQLTDANSRYDRHNAANQNGFTDPELRDAVEWAYNKAMQGNDAPTPLADWLASAKPIRVTRHWYCAHGCKPHRHPLIPQHQPPHPMPIQPAQPGSGIGCGPGVITTQNQHGCPTRTNATGRHFKTGGHGGSGNIPGQP